MILRVSFAAPGFFINDPRVEVRLGDRVLYDGSFTNGFDVSIDVSPGRHTLETARSGRSTAHAPIRRYLEAELLPPEARRQSLLVAGDWAERETTELGRPPISRMLARSWRTGQPRHVGVKMANPDAAERVPAEKVEDDPDEVESAWAKEIEQRLGAYREGKAKVVSGDEFFAALDGTDEED